MISIIRLSLLLLLVSFLSLTACDKKKKKDEADNGSQGDVVTITAPTSLTVAFSTDFDSTPTVTVAGVASGLTIELFSDSTCTTSAGSAIAGGSTVNVTATALGLGSYTFYAKSSISATSSPCSTAHAAYTYVDCPAGYVEVPGNATRSVNPFCVMQFEAKNVGGAATSAAAPTPWTNVSAGEAKGYCKALNGLTGHKYNLISNQEWMTIADNAEAQVENYSENLDPSALPIFPRGNSGLKTSAPVGVSNVSDHWNQSWTSPVWDYRRTTYLSNGAIIWDLAGNAQEIVDWGVDNENFTLSPACGPSATGNYRTFQVAATECSAIAAANYAPINPTWDFAYTNIGAFRATVNETVLTRGGQWNETTYAGIAAFYKTVIGNTSTLLTNAGFRCVYRPSL